MIPPSREDQKKEAFRLFEDGRYPESLALCNAVLETEKDPAVEVLAATNLFSAGRLEDAELFFRDLAQRMPESSYVHSYLAKTLEARGDESAIVEYATAVHLDPENQDALRSYAEYLLARKDYRGALPILRKLTESGGRQGDLRNLMRTLVELDLAREALATGLSAGVELLHSHEYVDALIWAGKFGEAAEAALAIWHETGDPAILRKHLTALAQDDVSAALDAYGSRVTGESDPDLLFDYLLLQKASGDIPRALETVGFLLSRSSRPIYRLTECDLLAAAGEKEHALDAYERLIRDELASKNDMETLAMIIRWYRDHLIGMMPEGPVTQRFLSTVSGDINVVSLVATGHLFEYLGNMAEARSWYYRAYRADYLTGGLEYARFLALNGEDRECEKVMLYILTNVKKGPDLVRVGLTVINDPKMSRLKRLMDQLIRRLEERRPALLSDGLELLASAFFIEASGALEEKDYTRCKYACLCGMDVIPSHSHAIKIEDFLRLARICKENSVADRPVMHTRPTGKRAKAVVREPDLTERLDLSEQEKQIVSFLRSHRKATEMDLRKLLGTRRVAGLVNRLVQKAAAQGLSLVAKKGVGEDGELYEYAGT